MLGLALKQPKVTFMSTWDSARWSWQLSAYAAVFQAGSGIVVTRPTSLQPLNLGENESESVRLVHVGVAQSVEVRDAGGIGDWRYSSMQRRCHVRAR